MKDKMYGRTNVWKQKGAGAEGSSSSIIKELQKCPWSSSCPLLSLHTDTTRCFPQDRSCPSHSPRLLSRTGQGLPFPHQAGSGPLLGDHREMQLGLSPLSHPCPNSRTWRAEGELRVLCVHLDTLKT